jgi:hypothetical protein
MRPQIIRTAHGLIIILGAWRSEPMAQLDALRVFESLDGFACPAVLTVARGTERLTMGPMSPDQASLYELRAQRDPRCATRIVGAN